MFKMMKPKAPRSMRHALWVGTRKAVVSMLIVGAAMFYAAQTQGTEIATPESAAPAQAATVAGEAKLNKMLDSGQCWTGGEGHPYPTAVVVLTDNGYTWQGQNKVDFYIEDFSRITPDVKAFCQMGSES